MVCVGYEYIRGSSAPECIFHNKHKILYNLVCPDSAVSCVDFTSYNVPFCSILGVSHFFLAVDSFTWDKWILLAAVLLDFFSKILEACYRCKG